MSIRDWVYDNVAWFNRVQRDPRKGWVGGVVAGIGEAHGWSRDGVFGARFALFFAAMCGIFPVIFGYLALWYLMDVVPGSDTGSRRNDRAERKAERRAARAERRSRRNEYGPFGKYGPFGEHGPFGPHGPFAGLHRRRPAMDRTEVRERFAKLESRLRDIEECVSSREFRLRRELRGLED